MRRTKIVATLGPASGRPEILQKLLLAGMDVARFNLSHTRSAARTELLAELRRAAAATGRRVAVMFDTRGPEVRIDDFPAGPVELRAGEPFFLAAGPRAGDAAGVGQSYPGLGGDLKIGDILLLDDGNLSLQVEAIVEDGVRTRVLNGGLLSGGKKVSAPGRRLRLPSLATADREDLREGVAAGIDFVAVSFVQGAEDVLNVRQEVLLAGGGPEIIAKIESRQGVENLEEILRVADGLMVARGDLGVELPLEEVPLWQKRLIARANRLGKPVITATQMLESMVHSQRPTRAEASDVANAILDGTDAVMLSAETAVGSYPVAAVQMMARIAERVEGELVGRSGQNSHPLTITEAISHATVTSAADLGARAILTATQSGHTARMVARFRPPSPIIAMTPDEGVARRLQLVWGVVPMLVRRSTSTDEMIDETVGAAVATGLIAEGDLVVITAGVPAGIPGTTNLLQVHTVGDVLVRGTGLGGETVIGPVLLARQPEEASRLPANGILVALATDRDYVPAMERAAAIVTEEGGLTSHAAVVGLSLGIPVVVGAEGALGILRDGEIVTVDGGRGLIRRGRVPS